MKLVIQLLCDNPKSWIVPYAKELKDTLSHLGHSVTLIFDQEEVKKGDILLLLSCENIFKKLYLNKHNLVVHESDLPHGKGWSPLTWQILEGKSRIPVTLFEAVENVDAGPIYGQEWIELNGVELIDTLRMHQFMATKKLILNFIRRYPEVHGWPQFGKSTFFPKRKPEHSELDVDKSLAEQFNLLRVVDNERYPAFFYINGEKFIIKIYKPE